MEEVQLLNFQNNVYDVINFYCPKISNCFFLQEKMMKFTQYFLHTRARVDRIGIKDEWIEEAVCSPFHLEIQSDGRIRKWVKVEEK